MTESAPATVRPSRAWMYQVLPIAALIVADIAFCMMLDTNFSQRKKDIIKNSPLFEDVQSPPSEFAKRINPTGFRITAKEYYENHREELDGLAKTNINADNIFWKVTFIDQHDEILLDVENPAKRDGRNNSTNCLFSRNFSGQVVRSFTKDDKLWARARFYYASPIGWPEIDALLARYRIAVATVIIVSILLYIWLYRALLRPLMRVAGALETLSKSVRVRPIHGAHSVIERSFNQLADSQRSIRLQGEVDRCLREIRETAHPDDTFELLFEKLPALVADAYDSRACALYRREGEGRFTRSAVVPPDNGHDLPQELASNDVHDEIDVWEPTAGGGQLRLAPLRCRGRHVGVLLAELSNSVDPDSAARSVQRILETGLDTARTDADRLAEERNRFGMTLATSMGHDLTNIIATSKWDLQTLEQAKSLGIIEINSQKGELYAGAVADLRKNMHFLQDIVDIYRAVGNARRPNYETVDLAPLLGQVTELFRRSTSSRLDIRCSCAEGIEVELEPRLIKMVVFNLLANASQVIRNRTDGKPGGEIEVAVERDRSGLAICVRDDGPGIRTSDGELMEGKALHRIFRAGYTTKPREASGGLGLSWAKHIVEEFHNGTIAASNRNEGGAEFRIVLPWKHSTSTI